MAAHLRPRNVRLDPLDGQQRKLWPAEQGDLRTGSGLSTVTSSVRSLEPFGVGSGVLMRDGETVCRERALQERGVGHSATVRLTVPTGPGGGGRALPGLLTRSGA